MFAKETNPAAAKDNMVNEGGRIANDVDAKAAQYRKKAAQAAHALKEDLEEMAHRAGCHARDLADSAGQNIEDIGETVTAKIRKKPLTMVAAAAGVGIVFGMLYRR